MEYRLVLIALAYPCKQSYFIIDFIITEAWFAPVFSSLGQKCSTFMC